MTKIKATLSSRKFWVAVFSSGLAVASERYEEAIAIWLGWAALEGYIDSKKVTR